MSDEDELENKLRTAIENVLGQTPYAIVWDATPLEDQLEDGYTMCVRLCYPQNQRYYTSRGLLDYGCESMTLDKD